MTSTDPKVRRPFYASRWLPWVLFGASVVVGFLLLVTTVAVAVSKTIPVAGPRVTVAASPLPAVTVAATPLPAETVTVTEDNSDEVGALKEQLSDCNDAWRDIASRENDALQEYAEGTQSIVDAIQNSDVSSLNDATEKIKNAGAIVKKATPLVPKANATCTAD